VVDFDLNHFGAVDFDLIYKSFFMGDLRFWFEKKTQWSHCFFGAPCIYIDIQVDRRLSENYWE